MYTFSHCLQLIWQIPDFLVHFKNLYVSNIWTYVLSFFIWSLNYFPDRYCTFPSLLSQLSYSVQTKCQFSSCCNYFGALYISSLWYSFYFLIFFSLKIVIVFQASGNAELSSESAEDSVLLQLQQITLPHYCLLCLFHTIPHIAHGYGAHGQNSINYSAMLAGELVKLLAVCVKPSIWRATDTVAQEVVACLNQVFNLLGEILEKHRYHNWVFMLFAKKSRKISWLNEWGGLIPVKIENVYEALGLERDFPNSLFRKTGSLTKIHERF